MQIRLMNLMTVWPHDNKYDTVSNFFIAILESYVYTLCKIYD